MFITSLPHLAKWARCKLGVALALWGPDRGLVKPSILMVQLLFLGEF